MYASQLMSLLLELTGVAMLSGLRPISGSKAITGGGSKAVVNAIIKRYIIDVLSIFDIE
jgi:hypothetical protein